MRSLSKPEAPKISSTLIPLACAAKSRASCVKGARKLPAAKTNAVSVV